MMDSRAAQYKRPEVTVLGLLAFCCGLVSFYEVSLIGQIFLIEPGVILLAGFVLIFGRGGKVLSNRVLKLLLSLSLLMLFGYMISDIIQGTAPQDYQRGWGRIGFLILDMVALSVLVIRDRSLIWWLLLGVGVGELAYLLATGVPLSDWKFGYSHAVMPILLCLSYVFLRKWSWAPFLLVGVISMFLDSRAISAASILTAALLFIKPRIKSDRKTTGSAIMVGVGVLLAGLVILAVLNATEDEFSERRHKSSSGRFAAIAISFRAVAESPIIGLGSWSESQKFARMLYEKQMADRERDDRHVIRAGSKFRPHSQVMQAWVEGGILAPWMFFALLVLIIRGIKHVAETRPLDLYSPIFIYMFVTQFWHILASPFGGEHRVDLAICIALLVMISEEQRKKVRDPLPDPVPQPDIRDTRLLRRRQG